MTELYHFLHIELCGSVAFKQNTIITVASDNGSFENHVTHLQPRICQLEEVKKGMRFCEAYCDLA